MLAVGGWRDQPYHSLPWEPIFLAQEHATGGLGERGDLEREAGEHIDTGIVQFRLACCHAQTGEHDAALGGCTGARALPWPAARRTATPCSSPYAARDWPG